MKSPVVALNADVTKKIKAEATARDTADVFKYKATFSSASWVSGTNSASKTIYTQSVTPTSLNSGPAITAKTQLSATSYVGTQVTATDEVLAEICGYFSAAGASCVTNDDGTITATLLTQPTADFEAHWEGQATA